MINAIYFATQVMAYKLLRMCKKDEVPAGTIVVAAKCTQAVQMSWAPFFLSEFVMDCSKII